jgi:predicted glycogen debranching enzyme
MAATPPVSRIALVHMPEVYLQTSRGKFPLSSFTYAGGVRYPRGNEFLLLFTSTPWPTWKFLVDGITVIFELFIPYKKQCVVMSWSSPQPCVAKIIVRTFFSGRNFHSLMTAKDTVPLTSSYEEFGVTTTLDGTGIDIVSYSDGSFTCAPQWNYNFEYAEERSRGYDSLESLPSPGFFTFELEKDPAVIIFGTKKSIAALPSTKNIKKTFSALANEERIRRKNTLRTAAETFLVEREEGLSLLAGYPWFSDWGRDTAIATRGLLIAHGFLTEAASVLLTWGKHIRKGLLPNRFLEDKQSTPEYNSVDAALWWVIAAYELLTHKDRASAVTLEQQEQLQSLISTVVTHYMEGTDLGISVDVDGLLLSGKQGAQLTWMDAKIGDYVVTPRMGKPVEIQALWINALSILEQLNLTSNSNLKSLLTHAKESFINKFWSNGDRYLADVVDTNFEVGRRDDSLRPNQLFATGGLPFPVVSTEQAQSVVKIVIEKLFTPGGLRTLSPDCRGYIGHYVGDQPRRDLAYHQGTAWPWLVGALADSYLYAFGDTAETRKKINSDLLQPVLNHFGITLPNASINEVSDGASPFTAKGAPFQAWSVGEMLRVWQKVSMR